ncbi:MAG: Hsp20/alpha crystallin family protein [Kofleriaceae bacterium]
MSNIIRRAEETPVAAREIDPSRWMRQLMSWDPFREMAPSWFPFERELKSFSPAFEVKENPDGYSFKADLPGLKEKDVEVKLTGNRLTISGKREQENEDKNDTYYTYERSYGSFTRAFTLPDGTDLEHVQAELKDGVLTIAVPKKAVVQPKTVTIKTSETKKS